MIVGILRLVLFIGNSNSLKSKRMVLNSLKAHLRNRFNISVCELDDHDKWQKTTLAIAGVQKDKSYIDREFSKIINFVENFKQVSIVDYDMQVL